jgi:hypothetical protein
MFIKDIHNLKPIFKLSYEQAKAMLNNGMQVDIEVNEHINKRSIAQNSYYWVINELVEKCLFNAGIEIAEEIKCLGIKCVRPVNKDDIHDINKKTFGIKSTKDLSVKEFCDYMEKLFIFWIENTKGDFEVHELPNDYLQKLGYMELAK